ncbi:MAG: energy transducer TonB [Arenimonas sp.]|nr:energy transducer TonB [Arenimonas sp.]
MSKKITAKDRLTGTFILSAIGYGVIVLGVGFTLNKAAPVTPTLDVILSPTASSQKPEQADFLSQANNQGGGNSDKAQRPKDNQLSQLPQVNPGDAPVSLQAQKTPPEPESVQRTLISHAPADAKTARAQEQKPNSSEALPISQELVEQSLALAKLANEYSQKQSLQARKNKHKFITASTQEYAYAQYMNEWVRKVERVGNANYPEQALLNQMSGQLILTVAIRKNGRIEGITVVKSSGNKILDGAAVKIVRLSEPFAALPATQEDPSVLYITRTWQFLAGQATLN